ncbi:hypothetical protein BDY24DRAFT_404681 [Mrakia frigida]|uniref:uncharacterized protein n=1 Tax=Mrakia frigida TaxID=29902 RepID=UPI003FCC0BB4
MSTLESSATATFLDSILPSSSASSPSSLRSRTTSRPTGSSLTGRPQSAWASARRTSAPGNTRITTTSRRSATATTRTSSSSSSTDTGLSEGALVGIGTVAGLLFIFALVFGCMLKEHRRQRSRRLVEEEECRARSPSVEHPPILHSYVGARAYPPAIRPILPRTPTPPPPIEDPDAADDRMERGDLFPPPPYKTKEGDP